MTTSRDHFYLNKTDGKLLGVCAGFADNLGVEAIWIRLALVVLTLLGWGATIPLYLLVAFVASRRPREYGDYDDDRAARRVERLDHRRLRDSELRRDLSDMDQRINEMERHFRARD